MNETLPISLNGGVIMRQTQYPEVRGHMDSAGLFDYFRNKPRSTDMGVIDYFATTGYMPQQMSKLNITERQFLDTHEFTYSHPTVDKDFYIMEDLSLTDHAGQAGATFKIKFNQNKYSNNWVITPDLQLPLSLLITADEIYRDGDGWVYTVQLKGQNRQERFFPKELLRAGTKFFATGTYGAEYNQVFSSIPTFNSGERKFTNFVGYGEAQLHYSVTRDAAMSKVSTGEFVNYDKFLEVIQTFEFYPGTLGYKFSMLTPEEQSSTDVVALYKRQYGKSAMNRLSMDTLLNVWAPKVEMLAMKILAQNVETEAYYGSGGTISVDGRTDVKTNLGLFHQYMLGNTANYNINYFTLEQLETIITSRIDGRVQFSPDRVGPAITVKTGKGGISLIHRLTRNLPSQAGLIWSIEGILKGLGGNNRNLFFDAPQIGSWTSASGIRINIEWEPSLDPQDANSTINPMVTLQNGVGGTRLSSYMFFIDDLSGNNSTGSQSNICELMYGPDWEMRRSYTNGNLAYPGSENSDGSWQRSNLSAGFEVYLQVQYKAYWLKDPTQSLVIKPLNPRTGKAIFEYR